MTLLRDSRISHLIKVYIGIAGSQVPKSLIILWFISTVSQTCSCNPSDADTTGSWTCSFTENNQCNRIGLSLAASEVSVLFSGYFNCIYLSIETRQVDFLFNSSIETSQVAVLFSSQSVYGCLSMEASKVAVPLVASLIIAAYKWQPVKCLIMSGVILFRAVS
jgi:hypothetical protein